MRGKGNEPKKREGELPKEKRTGKKKEEKKNEVNSKGMPQTMSAIPLIPSKL